jgi:hypothetical protein
MSQVCGKCSRVNPPEATYCYWDGAVLEGHLANGGPVAGGSRPFPSHFVFPSGQVCRNFDQLAMGCQQNWKQAVDLLKKGYLASFLAGLGRADLALAAREAARFPDQDRGLDQLLAKLPSHVLEAPQLKVEPTDVNLGVLRVGTDRALELHLSNLGMRLLYGSVVSECKWLTFGEGPGSVQRLFQFGNEALLQVHVRGQHLRAGAKPLEGRLVVESNGGTATVTVRAEVPIKPFPDGVLAGARTPRQIAEKAKAQPKGAALLFESGAVAQWFRDNGWTYPVQGPSASGLGAVQQFFEALGLATAPKLEINQRTLGLRGDPGQSLQTTLEVRTPEKRPVYAHASADEAWLDVSETTLNGRFATITVRVPSVPDRPGQTLSAVITVTGNGNQRFKVPVTLAIGDSVYHVQAVPVVNPVPVVEAVPVYALEAVPVVPALPVPAAAPVPVVTVIAEPVSPFEVPPAAPVMIAPRPSRRPAGPALGVHLVAAVLLVLVLAGVVLRDALRGGVGGASGDDGIVIDHRPRIAIHFEDGSPDEAGRQTMPYLRFGVVTLDPDHPRATRPKKLTYNDRGTTNSTVVRIGDASNTYQDLVFGAHRGRWEIEAENTAKWGGKRSVWLFDDGIRVAQTVEVIPGEPVEVSPGTYHRLLDTCLVRYVLENADSRPHKVGIRVLIDTLIGANDGVPFTVPGVPGLVDTFKDFKTPQSVPDFVLALERGDLEHPGTVAQMNFKLGGKLEPPDRVSLTRWPGRTSPVWQVTWDVPVVNMGDDSAVVMYWLPRELRPGEKRDVGFSYGLGSVAAVKGGALGVTLGGSFTPGGELTVVGLVGAPQPGQTLTLDLPPGFDLVDGAPATRPVPPVVPGRPSPVTWRIRSGASGRYDLTVRSSTGAAQKRQVTIKTNTIF